MGLRLLVVAFLVGAAFAGPLQRQTSQCATQCSSSGDDKFNYEPGKKYVYSYEGVNHVVMAGHRRQTTRINAQVEIHVKTKCDMVLKVKDIQIQQKATQEETEELKRKLEIPLPFAFEDGAIDRVCSSPEESLQSLNIKKGILSTFINTMDRFDQSQEVSEVDSLGTCATKYSVRRSQQGVIDKEKDLKSCTNRHASITSVITNPYESPESAIHSAPIFPTDKLSCQQTIEQGVYKSCSCKEIASLKPLGQNSGIEFEGQVQLALASVQPADNLRIHSIQSPEAIMFNLQEEHTPEDTEREIVDLLKRKCSRETMIDLSASKDFIYLVGAVRRLPYQSLQRIYSSLESGSICSSKKVTNMFMDTLPMAGSDGAIQLMVNLLVQQRVTGLKASLWSASLALVSHPSHDAVKAAWRLVKEQRSRSVLLGVSSMVYRHCLHHSCENHQEVKDIVTTLNQVLGQNCNYESESEAVAVLKAFGNMGQILHAEKNILACAKDSEKPVYVRVAAIDAFRRTNTKRPNELLELYSRPQEDYEVRIAALRSVLSQADKRQIGAIKIIAEQERHEQVAAYTASLISNMNKTSSPLKRSVRQRLNQYEINTPNVGFWENSKNVELSTFSQVFNVGGGVETDIIHSPESKVPRSIRTRFDVDVFDKHLNVFEMGIRAEGLEAAFKRLIEKFQSKEQQKSSWSLLKSRSDDDDDDKLEAQFFFRTMDTEIADFAVSDLTSMSEIIEVADILNKLSHEKSADFSHSFMFVNSKLVIPSVTGRSYSFGLTGSATVGLTASSKVDIVNILSKSKNCDVHGHFQPSVNVEFAATVGIHSEKPRPDMKIVTRLHSESHIEAQFKIKDSHVGLVKVSVPSENIAYTKVSTDIFEVDAYHQEKPVYGDMQKKIDYCFDKLEKPLGLSVCGKWEVPRPFMSKTFPFVKGVGNMELAIKKTDAGMKSYEFSVEVPKRKSSVMTYKAALDTPGSLVNRRFSADLEVQMPSGEQKQISLQIKSPFQSLTASAKGKLTTRSDLIEGTLDMQAGSSRRISIKASSPVSETSSEMTYKPSVQISYPSSQPLKIDGSLAISKGRKQQISFEMKSNKPSRKPMTLKGTIMKEGELSIAKSAEWKLSSDIALESSLVNLNLKSSTEKQSRQSHKVSSTVSVAYQTERSQRESLKLSANFLKSSSKISSVAQFETSQYPSANFQLTWNMQGKRRESLKNDITLKYGTDPEHNYVNILQSSRISASQPGECKLAVKAPEFDIDCDLTVVHEMQADSRVHIDADLRYKQDKHVRSKFYFDKVSAQPLKLKMKAEILTPSQRMMYQDELEETSQNSYRGNAVLEWQAGRRTELQYKYQKLSDRSKLHHEIETSLRLPSSRSPIKNKASIEISSENIGIEGRVSIDRNSEYTVKALLNKRGASYVNLKVPKLEGNLKVVNDADKKAANIDLKSNLFRQARHVTASASLGLGSQKKLETEICLDADRYPEKKFLFSTSWEKQPRNKYECRTKFQVSDKMSVEASASGDRSLYGRQEASVKASVLQFQPIEFSHRHELSESKISCQCMLSKNQRPMTEMSFTGERTKRGAETELSAEASLKSLDNSFQTKKWSYKGSYSRSSESSAALKYNAKLELSPSKIYEGEASFDLQPNVLITKAFLSTPHTSYRRQSISLSLRRSDLTYLSSASIELPNGKSMSISSEIQNLRGEGLTCSLIISSPFQAMRDVRASLSYDNKKSQKNLKSAVDVNGARKADIEFSLTSGRMTEIRGLMKTPFTPDVSCYVKCENNKQSFKYELQIMKSSKPVMSASLSKQSSNQDVSYSLQASSQEKTLVNMQMSRESTPSSIKQKLQAEGVFPEISLHSEFSRKDKNSVNLGLEACLKKNEKSCYSVKGYHKSLVNEENYTYYRKLTIDVEKSSENSSPKNLASASIVGSATGNDYREKFIVDVEGKKVGYEIRLHMRQHEQDHCSLDSHIFTPASTIRVRGSTLHNDKVMQSDFEIVPDASVPSRKLGFELKTEMKKTEVSGYMQLYHPERSSPVKLSGRIQREGVIPVSGKLTLNYKASRGENLVFEIIPEQGNRKQQEIKRITYKLYKEDKSFEATLRLLKLVTSRQSEYGYDWTYLNKNEQKQGKLSLKLSRESSGKPRTIEIEFNTPRASSKLSSAITWEAQIPKGIVCNFISNNEKIFEMEAKAEQDCIYVSQQLKSRPFMEHTVCAFKRQGQTTKLVSAQSTYQRRPWFQFEIEVDPDERHYPTIKLIWSERTIRSAKNELQQLREVCSRYVSSEDLQSIQKATEYVATLCSELFGDSIKKIQEFFTQQWYALERYISKAQLSVISVWDSVSQQFPFDHLRYDVIEPIVASIQRVLNSANNYLDEQLRAMWEVIIKKCTGGLRVLCTQKSFCYEYADKLEGMKPEQMKRLLSNKVQSMKRSVSQSVKNIQFPDIPSLIENFYETVKREYHNIFNAIADGKLPELFSQYVRRLENLMSEDIRKKYEAFKDWVSEVIQHFERDEDFRVVQALAIQCKEKLLALMQQIASSADNVWRPMCEYLKEYPQKWMTVHKFSPREGNIEVQLHQPIEDKHIELARNVYVALKNKITSQ